VAAHLDAGPTGPPGKCQTARRPSPPMCMPLTTCCFDYRWITCNNSCRWSAVHCVDQRYYVCYWHYRRYCSSIDFISCVAPLANTLETQPGLKSGPVRPILLLSGSSRVRVGGVAKWLRRRSSNGELSLIYAWSMVLTCDHFVGKVSAMGQPTRLTQPSVPPGSVNE